MLGLLCYENGARNSLGMPEAQVGAARFPHYNIHYQVLADYQYQHRLLGGLRMLICCLNHGTQINATIESMMFQSSFRIHVVPEAPIGWKRIPQGNLVARLELVMNRNIREGIPFPISPGLLLPHDLVAVKAIVEKRTGGVVFALLGVPGALASSTIAWQYCVDTFAEYSQIIPLDIWVVNGVRKLMSTITSTLNIKTTEHQQRVSFHPYEAFI